MGRKNEIRRYRKAIADVELRHRWEDWLAGPGRSLLECGFPSVVFADERHWVDFLVHGYFDYHQGFPSDFSYDELTAEQAQKAIEVITEKYLPRDAHPNEYDLVGFLRERLGLSRRIWETPDDR